MRKVMSKSPLLAALVVLIGWAHTTPRLTILPESRLWVEGTSTLHDWTCEIEAFTGSIDVSPDALTDISQVRLDVPINEMECKNGTMNKKARAALDVKNHPVVTYELSRAGLVQPLQEGAFVLETTGRLTIAGTTREVTATVEGMQQSDGTIRFSGQVPIRMTDFNVDPPSAMLGTLKTGDDVVVHFDIVASL